MATIDISMLDKAEVLAALYNGSKPQGAGVLHFDARPMTKEEAQGLLDKGNTDFDYLKGRVMKVDLSGQTFDTWGYDRDLGQGAAQRAIDSIQCSGKMTAMRPLKLKAPGA